MDLTSRIGRLHLANPILVASGTFGYAKEAARFVDFARLGGIVPKTVTLDPRMGNPPPRIVETASGMLNAIGLDNDGIEHFLISHMDYLRTLNTKIIVNVAGKSVEEFRLLCERLCDQPGIAAVELNLSCPNVSGGIDFATDPRVAHRVVADARAACPFPILAKLTPNVTDVVLIARAVQEAGADGVTLINTVLGAAINWRTRRPMLANNVGGLSGPAIKPVALRIVMQVAGDVGIPIVGAGGVATIDDVMEFFVAGAAAVQLGTVNFTDPSASMRILDQLPRVLADAGVNKFADVVGTVQLY